MQKTKTHLRTSNISFFPFLLLFSLGGKLGKFYSFANYKILSMSFISAPLLFLMYILLFSPLFSFFDFKKKNILKNNFLKILTYSSPLLETGTHINSIGGQVYWQLIPKSLTHSPSKNNQNKPNQHQWLIKLTPKININDLGIPGNSLSLESTIRYLYSFGKKNYSYHLTHSSIFASKTHSLSFAFNSYLTTDRTSQITGIVYYEYLAKDFFWGIEFENDVFVPVNDKYRTGGLEFKYGYKLKTTPTSSPSIEWLTFSFGFIIWTGERIIERSQFNRNIIIPLFYGKEYSHGILYLSLNWKHIQISLGYDSEEIRSALQNGFHFVINDGMIPIIDREDRWFLQVKFFDLGTLY